MSAKKRVLLVEDEPGLVLTLTDRLEAEGYHVDAVTEGDKALDKARDDNPALEFAGESWSAQQADALVTMANAYLGGNAGADSGASENYLVNLHVEQSALVNGQGRAGLSPQTLRGRSPRPTLVGRR